MFSKKNRVIGMIRATDKDSAKALSIKSIIKKMPKVLNLDLKNRVFC